MVNYYSLEGLGACGKTTLLQSLAAEGYSVILEIADDDRNTSTKQLYTNNEKQSKYVNEWFLKKELQRITRSTDSEIVFMERCVYSQIVYNYAKEQLLGKPYLKELFIQLQTMDSQAKLLQPQIIFLDIEPELSLYEMTLRDKHREKKNIQEKVLSYTKEFLELQQQAYLKILSCCKGIGVHISVDETRNISKETIINFINKKHSCLKSYKEIERCFYGNYHT